MNARATTGNTRNKHHATYSGVSSRMNSFNQNRKKSLIVSQMRQKVVPGVSLNHSPVHEQGPQEFAATYPPGVKKSPHMISPLSDLFK